MSSLLSAELAATCSALGYYDVKSNKYYADSNTLETVKDLIRYLRRDDESHDIRRQLGEIKVLQNDLIPLLKSYWEENDLFDVLLRLLVNLSTPALMLWNEELPTDKISRNHYLQVEDHLKNSKQAFADDTFWAVLSTKLSKILETDYSERGDENSLVIERILILIRNILYVPPDPTTEKRPDNDASIHDQVLWALHQSGMLDIILYITTTIHEKAYFMHTLEILSFMLREQRASELARAALQRSETEKTRDEAELLAIRHRETNQKQQKVRKYNGARHSRFGGTFVLKSMKSISDNELIYHKPLNNLESLNFDVDKKKPKTPKNRMPVQTNTFERLSAFSIRLFLKEFCVEFLNGAYNTLMYHVKDNLVRARAQAHDESYYLWALRFFMEFNRCYKFEVKLVSETVSVQIFRYVQQLMETYFDMIQTDKKKVTLWSRRLHLALLAYRELLLTVCVMDKSPDGTVQDSAKVIKNNLFYILEYREFIVTLLITYDELKMSDAYLNDLMETQHIFIKMLEAFCGTHGSVVVQKKTTQRRKKKKATQDVVRAQPDVNLDSRWDELAPQISTVLEGNAELTTDVIPFDATSDIPIDEQKEEAMKNVQRKLRSGILEDAISLLRAAREVWPENNCFGSNNMAPEEEFLALREIFFADLGENETSQITVQQPIYDDNGDEEEGEDHEGYGESDFKFQDFTKRLANPKIVRACGLALKNFESNLAHTNHCIIKLLHRIAFDLKFYVMVFQVSIFRTFQKIYSLQELPQYQELVNFAAYVIRQFVKITAINKKVYLESLFWKNSGESYEIEYGYGSNKQKLPARAWSEMEEDELRRLFMEHQQNQLEDDVVDWIVNNLIDNTRTRRGVLKKLKEICLLTNYKGPHKSGPAARVPRQWGDEEETQLRELFEQFKEAAEPLGCITARLDVTRGKRAVVQKLLDLGLIRNRSEVRKKRSKSSRGSKPDASQRIQESDNDTVSSDSDDDNEAATSSSTSTRKKLHHDTSSRRKSSVKPKKTIHTMSYSEIARQLVNLVNTGLSDALDWLKESFSDAVEDFEDGSEGIPLVPIMDYAVDAMENTEFQQLLRALGIVQPFDEQEMYWRIPGNLPVDLLNKYIDMLLQAIDNTLAVSDNSQPTPGVIIEPATDLSNDETVRMEETETENNRRGIIESDEESDNDNSSNVHRQGNTSNNYNMSDRKQVRNIIESDNEDTQIETDEPTISLHVLQKRSARKIIDSDEDDEEESRRVQNHERPSIIDDDVSDDTDHSVEQTSDGKRSRTNIDLETVKPAFKKRRVISSDEY